MVYFVLIENNVQMIKFRYKIVMGYIILVENVQVILLLWFIKMEQSIVDVRILMQKKKIKLVKKLRYLNQKKIVKIQIHREICSQTNVYVNKDFILMILVFVVVVILILHIGILIIKIVHVCQAFNILKIIHYV